MTKFDWVTQQLGDVKYMKANQAHVMRRIILEHNLQNILELGFAHGKSSAYIAAILEDQGIGKLTTIDLISAREREPSIDEVLNTVGLAHRVEIIYAQRSYNWELGKMLQKTPMPSFDLCYIDGGHTWDVTGFGFVLTDMLLRPGGWVVFDDLNWTLAKHLAANPQKEKTIARRYSADEINTAGVRMVWDLIVPRFGYINGYTEDRFGWGIVQKPERNSE